MPLDAMQLTRIAEEKTLRGRKRKYYRFRVDRWYGGVVTGDVVGCNLRCIFCWSRSRDPNAPGDFHSPEEAAERMARLAKRRRIRQARLSGAEPTIGWLTHSRDVAANLQARGMHFILETNGILVGSSWEVARSIASLKEAGSLEVRVSIKGCTPETFERITLVRGDYWYTQIEALRKLIDSGLEPGEEVYPAVMLSFDKNCTQLIEELKQVHPKLAENIDPEYVILYPHVAERLRRTGLWPRRFFKPGEPLPDYMI